MVAVVTSATADYLPGVIALRNSLKRNWPGQEFFCLAYGDGIVDTLEREGIAYWHNEEIPAPLPCSYKCETPNPAMYSRLLIPGLFPKRKRTLYIDADSIVLRPMGRWIDADLRGCPVAGTPSWAPVHKELIGSRRTDYGVMSSVLVFDHKAWFEKEIFDKCMRAMREEPHHFKTVVQAVLQHVLVRDWFAFPKTWQVQGGHRTVRREIGDADVLHFAGTNPWDAMPEHLLPMPEHKQFSRAYWRDYA